jgi:hypothetical protein
MLAPANANWLDDKKSEVRSQKSEVGSWEVDFWLGGFWVSYLVVLVVLVAFGHCVGALGLEDHCGFGTEPCEHWQSKYHTRWRERPADKSAGYAYKARLRGLCVGGRYDD